MTPGYFTTDELQILQDLEYRILQDIYYHIWVNKATPAEPFEIIDYIELIFEDGGKFILTGGAENDGIHFFRGNIDDAKAKALIEVGNVVSYRKENMSGEEPWSEAMAKPIIAVNLSSD